MLEEEVTVAAPCDEATAATAKEATFLGVAFRALGVGVTKLEETFSLFLLVDAMEAVVRGERRSGVMVDAMIWMLWNEPHCSVSHLSRQNSKRARRGLGLRSHLICMRAGARARKLQAFERSWCQRVSSLE